MQLKNVHNNGNLLLREIFRYCITKISVLPDWEDMMTKRMNKKKLFLPGVILLIFLSSLSSSLCNDTFTFAVIGDSRPERDLKQPEAFSVILEQINELSPDVVFHTGDVIYGKTRNDENLKKQYNDFFAIVKKLDVRLIIAPGNHDIWNEASAKAFKERFGYLYTSFTFGSNHFILLNSELPHRACMIEGEQLAWLESELSKKKKEGKNIFVILHRPLFPTNRYIGKSMDKYPEKRDRLHGLFRRYGIKYVLMGHEHIYSRVEKDGIIYLTTGGSGASLYADEKNGGFHHFLFFTVRGDEIRYEVKKVRTP